MIETAERPPSTNVVPRHGVLVLAGYGLRIAVERGHLAVADGVGTERKSGLIHRATSGLRRLVVLGHAGTISLEALKWLADVGVPFVQIDRDGNIVAVTAPLGSDDARNRRSQALATTNGVGLELARTLLRAKIERQRALLARLSPAVSTLAEFAQATEHLESSSTIEGLRLAESRAAAAYWSSWTWLQVRFAKRDEQRVPAHWLRFDARSSPIANGPRLAVNPVNALLNYLYGILEAEARIACLTVGLDPGMGVLHADQRGRDSLALDLVEPVRPRVDALVLDLQEQRVFAARDFFEMVQGTCRLMPSLARPLAEHAPVLAKWVAPYAEQAAREFAKGGSSSRSERIPATPLTQANRRAGRDGIRVGERKEPRPAAMLLPNACRGCGLIVDDPERVWCDGCYAEHRAEKDRANMARATAAKTTMRAEGRDPSHGGAAAAKRSARQREQLRLNAEWDAGSPPVMAEAEYRTRVLPGLADVPVREVAQEMGVSNGYAARVRRGDVVPHPRHWQQLRAIAAASARLCREGTADPCALAATRGATNREGHGAAR